MRPRQPDRSGFVTRAGVRVGWEVHGDQNSPSVLLLPTWSIARCVWQVLDVWDGTEDPLPESLRREHRLSGLEESLRGIHRPDGWPAIKRAEQLTAGASE